MSKEAEEYALLHRPMSTGTYTESAKDSRNKLVAAFDAGRIKGRREIEEEFASIIKRAVELARETYTVDGMMGEYEEQKDTSPDEIIEAIMKELE